MIPVEKRLLVKVANMYYLENMKQSEIADKLGVNRTTVSKYLKRAMESGIVKISIVDNSYGKLEAEMEKVFGLKEAYIVAPSDDPDEVKNNMGQAGLAYLKRIVTNGSVLGLAWGTTMGAMAKHALEERGLAFDVDIVPLVGGPEYVDSEFHVNTICYKTAHAFGARNHYLYAPAITKSPEIREAIIQDINYMKIVDLWNRMTIAVVGIGAPVKHSNLVWMGKFGNETIHELAEAGVVGEICSVFYDRKGNVVPTELSDRTIAIELERLKRLKYSIGIATSCEKVPAIHGAISGKLINVLITDAQTAQLLLDYHMGEKI